MEYALVIFILTLLLITAMCLWVRAPPFFTLIAGALFYGLASGMNPDSAILAVLEGLGKTFAIFAVIILCGAIIAKTLHAQGLIEGLVSDLRRRTEDAHTLSGLGGYIFAIPTACCITAFVMLAPILERIGTGMNEHRNYLYLAAVGSVLSYTLIYPTPVVIPLFSSFGGGAFPLVYDMAAIPLSLGILAAVIFLSRSHLKRKEEPRIFQGDEGHTAPDANPPAIHWKAWAPFLAILLAIPLFSLVFPLSHASMIQCIMAAGMIVALILAAPEARTAGISQGTRHAGVILFDICGAGALGNVIAGSDFSQAVFPAIEGALPLVLLPFAFTALIQAAQGSRVVSAMVSSQVLAGTQIAASMHPVPMILSVAAGTCAISYLTDPYFWLLQRTTGDGAGEVMKRYTLPLAAGSLVVLAVAVALQVIL